MTYYVLTDVLTSWIDVEVIVEDVAISKHDDMHVDQRDNVTDLNDENNDDVTDLGFINFIEFNKSLQSI